MEYSLKMNLKELRKNLESESGYLNWQELEKHFARGAIRVISSDSNLIDLAMDIAQNKTDNITNAISNNSIFEPTNSQALHWQQNNSNFLCVVVAPFVLIQENEFKSGYETDLVKT